MTRGRLFAFIAVTATLLAVLGCGGGGSVGLDDSTGTYKVPTVSANARGKVSIDTSDGLSNVQHNTIKPVRVDGDSLLDGGTGTGATERVEYVDPFDPELLPSFADLDSRVDGQHAVSAMETIDHGSYTSATDGVSFADNTLTIPSEAGTTEWAHYALDLTMTEDFVGMWVQGTLTPAATGSTGLWIGLSNYSRGQWTFLGPYDLSSVVKIESVDPVRYGSEDDVMHLLLITTGGDQADITQLWVNRESGVTDVPPEELASAILDGGISYDDLSLRRNHSFYGSSDPAAEYLGWTYSLWNLSDNQIMDQRTYLPAQWSAWSGTDEEGFFQPHEYPLYQLGKQADLAAVAGMQDALHEGINNHHPFDALDPVTFDPVLEEEDTLAAAIVDLVVATGGVTNETEIETALAGMSQANQEALANVIVAVKEAYTARQAGLETVRVTDYTDSLDVWFAKHHGFWMSNLYGGDSLVPLVVYSETVTLLYVLQYPYQTTFFEGSSKITYATDALRDYIDAVSPTWEDVNLEVETPAGLIKISGTGDDTHLARRPMIIGKDSAAKTYTVAGDMVDDFLTGSTFTVYAATEDNGSKTVVDATLDAGNTVIEVSDDLTGDSADGLIYLNGYLVLIDLGGNDTYTCTAGATATDANGVSVCLDFAGNDDYLPLDDPLDGNREELNDDNTAQYGAARLGVGILADFAGDDNYSAVRMSEGFACFGVGMLCDFGLGDDTYTGESFCQGSAMGGIGILYDDGAAAGNTYSIYANGQGYGASMGVGMLIQQGEGSDVYIAQPAYDANRPEYNAGGSFAGVNNQNSAQGCGWGRSIYANEFDSDKPYCAPGGFGLLYDAAGDDTYTAALFAQGVGYFHGHGLLIDSAGDDTHEGVAYTQAASLNCGVGGLWENAGDDLYTNLYLVSTGGAQDGSVSWFYDVEGHDIYDTSPVSLGSGMQHAYAFFIDAFGNDTYSAAFADPVTQCLGRGGWPGSSNDITAIFNTEEDPAIGIFVDHRGADDYAAGFMGMLSGVDDTTVIDTPPANGGQWVRNGGAYTAGGFYAAGKGSGIDGE